MFQVKAGRISIEVDRLEVVLKVRIFHSAYNLSLEPTTKAFGSMLAIIL